MADNRRLIDANTLYDELSTLSVFVTGIRAGKGVLKAFMEQYRESVLRIVDEQATVEAGEVVHGRWTATDVIVRKAGYGVRYYYHAECKVNPNRLFECENDYCPNCGAKMNGEAE
jgi:hypothetical protein